MSRWTRISLALACLLMPAAGTAHGQSMSPPDTVGLSERLQAESRARLLTSRGRLDVTSPRLVKGEIEYQRAHFTDPADLSTPLPPHLPLSGVSEIQLPRRATAVGAAVGAVAGAGLTLLALIPNMRPCRRSRDPFEDVFRELSGSCGLSFEAAALLSAAVGAGGGVVGGLIASPFDLWITVYRAPTNSSDLPLR